MRNKKIAHVITRMILGGAQENTLFTVVGLAAQHTYDVCLITGPAIGREGELFTAAERKGTPIYLVNALRREIHPVRDLVSLFQLIRLFHRLRPDIVHTHSSKAGILGRWAAWLAHVPIIVHTIHGVPFHPYQNAWVNRFYIFLERMTAHITDHLITVAQAMTEKALVAGIAQPGRFTTIYSGMEVDEFLHVYDIDEIRHELDLHPGDRVIGEIARLAPLKGHSIILDIAPELLREFPQLKFIFLGDGPLRETLATEIRQKNLEKCIRLVGLVPAQEIPRYLQVMDIVVHPSLREGLARVLPQAVLAQKPVVAFDVDGAKEIVIDGQTGYLVPPGSREHLIDALRKLLREERLARPWPEEERRAFIERFRVETMVQQISDLYQKLLEQKA